MAGGGLRLEGCWVDVAFGFFFRPRASSKPGPFVPQKQRTCRDCIGMSVSCREEDMAKFMSTASWYPES